MIFLDLETRSQLDLRKVGPYVYAAHPSTKILCAAWARDDGVVALADEHERCVRVLKNLQHEEFVAHNCEFERAMLWYCAGVFTRPEQWHDTAAMGAAAGFPRDLEELAIALGLDEKADPDGHRVMLRLSKPRRASKEDRAPFWTPETKPEEFQRLYAYCKQDVETMRAAWKVLPPLSAFEREVFQTTLRMNIRGVKLDVPSIEPAIRLARHAEADLSARFQKLVGHSPMSPRAVEALGLDSLDKVAVRNALKDPGLPPPVREALELRRAVAKSSVKKLHAMQDRVSEDGHLRGQFVYCGAERTGRWSARGVQPQNFPRGLGEDTDEAFRALEDDVLDLIFPDVLPVLSDMLRGFFVGPFLVGDYSQIEARVLAWFAGQNDLLDLFRTGGDPYCEMASSIYGRKITKADTKERFLGKQTVLGCGYGMGPDKFRRTLDDTYDVQVAPDFAEKAVYAYRRRFAKVPAFWKKLEDGFKFVLSRKAKRVPVGRLFMGTGSIGKVPVAWIELPSGRRLWYAYPRLIPTEYGHEIRYFGRNQYKGGKWEEIHSYGGRLTENVVQATSRELLAHGMVKVEAAGFRTVATIHDEVVVEAPATQLTAFKGCLTVLPEWAAGLPLDAECFATQRYRK